MNRLGMAIAEALLCGCPVIANDLPVFREVFPDSPLFKRVEIWQPASFVSAVEGLPEGQVSAEAERSGAGPNPLAGALRSGCFFDGDTSLT